MNRRVSLLCALLSVKRTNSQPGGTLSCYRPGCGSSAGCISLRLLGDGRRPPLPAPWRGCAVSQPSAPAELQKPLGDARLPQKRGRAGEHAACTQHVFRARTRRAHGASCAHPRRVSRRAEQRASRRAEQRVSWRAEKRVSRRAELRVSRHADSASSSARTVRLLGVRRVSLYEPVCLNSGLVAVFFQIGRRLRSITVTLTVLPEKHQGGHSAIVWGVREFPNMPCMKRVYRDK